MTTRGLEMVENRNPSAIKRIGRDLRSDARIVDETAAVAAEESLSAEFPTKDDRDFRMGIEGSA